MKAVAASQLQVQRNGTSPDDRVVVVVLDLLREGYEGCPECPGCLTDIALRAAREWEREITDAFPAWGIP